MQWYENTVMNTRKKDGGPKSYPTHITLSRPGPLWRASSPSSIRPLRTSKAKEVGSEDIATRAVQRICVDGPHPKEMPKDGTRTRQGIAR